MNEPTVQFLVNMSHKWSWIVLPLPIVFGATAHCSGLISARNRARGNARTRIVVLAVRAAARALFGLSLVTFAISITHWGCAVVTGRSMQCISNMKKLATGELMYAQDYDGRFPPSSQWTEAIDSHVRAVPKSDLESIGSDPISDPFVCPSAESPASYGMNASLNQKTEDQLKEPGTVVLFFDANASNRSFAGSATDVARERHGHAPNVAFADGHVKKANDFTFAKLNWDPRRADQ